MIENTKLPLVSLVVLTYNQEQYIRETLDSVFSQDYNNLEIVISDDCSADRTYDIIMEYKDRYEGSHRLIVNRNKTNMGLVNHYNNVLLNYVHGEYFFGCGGDDVLLSTSVSTSVEKLLNAKVSSMSFNSYIINEKSERIKVKHSDECDKVEIYDLNDYLSRNYKTHGACRIIKYDIYKSFGPLAADCQTEDTTMLLRSFLYGPVGYSYTPNTNYRVHGNNLSSQHNLMTRFNPIKIARQYKKDIKLALTKGMIDQKQYKQLMGRVARYKKKNVWLRFRYRVALYVKKIIHLS